MLVELVTGGAMGECLAGRGFCCQEGAPSTLGSGVVGSIQ